MSPMLSPNTKAILMLTAPLIAGRNAASPGLLSPSEYNRLACHLRDMRRQPADLLSPESAELLRTCQTVIDIEVERLRRLLERGFLLSQAVERWQARAIWVVSRADDDYPRRLKERLKEYAPAVLYGCGALHILDTGGLAVVGSRHVDETLIDYTLEIGRLSAKAGKTLISGGAKGIDQAAMRGALEAGGQVSGVLGDSLEKTAMNREHRDMLMDGQLVLISPYDPSAGFNIGNAMQRNKLIYALADAALVVSSDFNKGGTWAGATEQLEKLRLVPIYVRSTGETGKGLEALRQKGALPWPDPQDADAFTGLLDAAIQSEESAAQLQLPPSAQEPISSARPSTPPQELFEAESHPPAASQTEPSPAPLEPAAEPVESITRPAICLADVLFATVRDVLKQLLKTPRKATDIAVELQVSNNQAKEWLQRLVDEGVLEKQKKPVCYVVNQQTELRFE